MGNQLLHPYGPRFAFALEVYAVGKRSLLRAFKTTPRTRGVNEPVHVLASGACTKILRLLHAAIILCRTQLAEEADALVRMEFEALLVFRWLLARRVVLKEHGKRIKHPPMRQPASHFRARLYMAHEAFELKRLFDVGRRRPFGTGITIKKRRDLVVRHADAQAALIGPEWTKRLEQRKTYSSLAVKDLATSLGVKRFYDMAYRMQSWTAHGADLSNYVTWGDDNKKLLLHFRANPDENMRPLSAATAVALDALELLADRFDLETRGEIQAMVKRAPQVLGPLH